MAEGRDVRQQLGLDVLPGDEELDRLDSRSGRSLDEILRLDGEEPCLAPVFPRREKLPDEPELLVLS